MNRIMRLPQTLNNLILCLTCLYCPFATAEITVDGTLSPIQNLTGPNYNIDAQLGRQQGQNLFHSFGKFNLYQGESATFNGPQAIKNIISRVTGGESSWINGAINSTIQGADFYFLNPAGVMFGEHASLDISGAFHVSTADALSMGEDGLFNASTPNDSLLSVDPPQAFHFIKSSPGDISLQLSQLKTQQGQTISLVGGNIEMNDAGITAESGHINMVAVNSSGQVLIDGGNLDPKGFTQYGNIVIIQNQEIQQPENLRADLPPPVEGDAPPTVNGPSPIDNESNPPNDEPPPVDGEVTPPTDEPPPVDGEVTPPTDEPPSVDGEVTPPIDEPPSVDGEVPPPIVEPPPVDGEVSPPIDEPPPGNGGPDSEPNQPPFLEANLDISGEGRGTIYIRGNQLIMQGSEINATTRGIGGDITVYIDNDFSMDNARLTGNTESTEDGGNITIMAGNLNLFNGAGIQTETYADGQGGNIMIEVQDTLRIDGTSTDPGTGQQVMSGLFSNAKAENGDGGNINITAGNINMDNGGAIHALTFTSGKAGNIVINTSNLEIADNANINTSASFESNAGGDAGSIVINAGGLIKINGLSEIDPEQADITGIVSDTIDGSLGGGQVTIRAADLILENNGEIVAKTLGSAQAGKITIETDNLSLFSGASISNSNETSSSGVGGALSINAQNIMISGAGTEKSSGLYSEAQGSGDGGDIVINTHSLSLNDEGRISVKSSAEGNAGSINVVSLSDIILDNGHIQTGADIAAGGFIDLQGRHIHLFDNSSIDAGVRSGRGGGGNITLTGLTLVALDNSDFTAFAEQGWGGNIVLNAQAVFFSADSNLNASSNVEGQDGAEQINSPEVDISATILSLPENFKDAQSILPESCAVRERDDQSSFIIDNAAGIPSVYDRLLLFP